MKTINLYTKSNCQMCVATKRWLDKRGTTYAMKAVDLDTEQSRGDYAALVAEGFQEMPVVIVQHGDGSQSSWTGFNPNLLGTYCTPEEAAA